MPVHKSFQKLIKRTKENKGKNGNLLDIHPSDLAQTLEDLTGEEKQEFFSLLSDEEAALIIQEMEDYDQVTLFRLLTKKRASEVLKEMSSDDAVDLLGEMSPEESKELLSMIDGAEEAAEIKGLLKYPEDTAGGIMTTEFIALPSTMQVEDAIDRLREIAPDAETVYYIYVIEGTRLIGVISLRELIAAKVGVLVKDIMRTKVISVTVDTDQEDVAKLVSKYDLLAVPVIDEKDTLLGIITVDDVLDVIEEETTEDIYRMMGTSEVEGVDILDATVLKLASKRLPWLLISLFGGLVSGSVVGAFEETLHAIVALAFFIPVIMDMGGNVGTQSSTVFVRGLATGSIDKSEVWRYFFREVKVGFFMGLVCGTLVSIPATIWQGLPALGVIVGIAMFFTVTLAAIIGTLVPLIFDKFGIDPAISSGPFVTTIKDVTGLMIYFYIASIFMDYLI